MNGHSYVYVIGSSAVKIGFTTDLDARLKALQSGSPVKLTVLWAAPVTDHPGAESHLHRVFSKKRLHGEWFDLDGDAIGQVSAALERYQIAEVERSQFQEELPADPRAYRGRKKQARFTRFTPKQIKQIRRDVPEIFAELDTDRMWRTEIRERLMAKSDAYQDMTQPAFARLLAVAFGAAIPIRAAGRVARGYYREDVTPTGSKGEGQ